jgi:hypothetical protein
LGCRNGWPAAGSSVDQTASATTLRRRLPRDEFPALQRFCLGVEANLRLRGGPLISASIAAWLVTNAGRG